jgi:hypothetical protein
VRFRRAAYALSVDSAETCAVPRVAVNRAAVAPFNGQPGAEREGAWTLAWSTRATTGGRTEPGLVARSSSGGEGGIVGRGRVGAESWICARERLENRSEGEIGVDPAVPDVLHVGTPVRGEDIRLAVPVVYEHVGAHPLGNFGGLQMVLDV